LLQQKLEALQQGISEQDKALRDANRRNAELMHELNSARTVIRWIGNNPAAVKKIGAEAVGEEKPAAAATEAAPAVTDAATDAVAAGSEPAKSSEEKPKAIGTPVVSKPPKPPKPVAPVVTETASLPPPFTDPLYLGGGAAVVGGAAVWALMRRRRKDSAPMFEDSLLAHNPPTKHVVIGSTGGAVIDTTLAMNSMLKDEDQQTVFEHRGAVLAAPPHQCPHRSATDDSRAATEIQRVGKRRRERCRFCHHRGHGFGWFRRLGYYRGADGLRFFFGGLGRLATCGHRIRSGIGYRRRSFGCCGGRFFFADGFRTDFLHRRRIIADPANYRARRIQFVHQFGIAPVGVAQGLVLLADPLLQRFEFLLQQRQLPLGPLLCLCCSRSVRTKHAIRGKLIKELFCHTL
jgi:hypothetical protein